MAKQLKEIEIPLGAKDSELCGWEYTIPEGMEATIVDNKIVVKKKESEDEKIRKWCISHFRECFRVTKDNVEYQEYLNNKVIPWFEKQGEKKNEVKYVYTKFRIGDVIVEIKPNGYCQPVTVKYVGEGAYSCESDDGKRSLSFPIKSQDEYKLVEQKPAWSEEDEKFYNRICDIVHAAAFVNYDVDEDGKECGEYAKIIGWLKSPKDRAQPRPKQEWSEEDKGNLLHVKCIIDEVWHNQDVREEINHSGEELEALWHWLDNVWQRVEYPQNTWKPNELQMEQLGWIAKQNKDNMIGKKLMSLYQDLKRL